jgi:hypothetical protein
MVSYLTRDGFVVPAQKVVSRAHRKIELHPEKH